MSEEVRKKRRRCTSPFRNLEVFATSEPQLKLCEVVPPSPYGRHVNSDFIISVFAQDRRVRLGRKGHRSTRTDGGKIASSIV